MKRPIIILAMVFLILPILVLAQSDGSVLPDSTSSPQATETPISTPVQTSAVSVPTQTQSIPARATILTPTPSPVLTSSFQAAPTLIMSITPTPTPRPTPAPSDLVDSSLFYGIIAGVASVFAFGSFVIYRGKIKRTNSDDDKFKGIKDLF